ncbi:ABC transporter permease [Cellulomonas wangsupingiae]|uniref:ABC transporter permease n=1 Tax=Cellulomonas wangsupingiae TaxID=2968085 RepID=A0ABY5K334_9CELL|nr:ABC transporter permease [Cellulomonas wangsupingiae]MCC2336141.1 ABC transporter permease [Cellulomonas wangsupingiae]MCM0639548.1 ABC transporter permease [Cellulomonas wangsupingiae]UUI64861.1 ABC transporter permease [Cellulomonas wangsupingiae]
MSTTSFSPTPAARTRPRTPLQPVTFPRLVASEWVKLRSLRSTWWALALALAFFPLLAAMRSSSIATIADQAPPGSFVGPAYVTSGVTLALLVLCGLAVVAVTGEYRTGQIRSTLVAAPTRLPALWAKLTVVVGVVLATSTVGVLTGWAAAAPWFDEIGMTVDLTDAEHVRLMLGVPLYLAAMAALAFGIGSIIRSAAAGITSVLGLVFVVEPAFAYIPFEPLQQFAAYLPTAAGARLVTSDSLGSIVTGSGVTTLTPWGGYGVLLVWVAVTLTVAAVLLRRRDA